MTELKARRERVRHNVALKKQNLKSTSHTPIEYLYGIPLPNFVPTEGPIVVHHILLVDEEIPFLRQVEMQLLVQSLQLFQLTHVVRHVHFHRNLPRPALGQHHQPQLLRRRHTNSNKRRRRRLRSERLENHVDLGRVLHHSSVLPQRPMVLQLGADGEQHEAARGNALRFLDPLLELVDGLRGVDLQRELALGGGDLDENAELGRLRLLHLHGGGRLVEGGGGGVGFDEEVNARTLEDLVELGVAVVGHDLAVEDERLAVDGNLLVLLDLFLHFQHRVEEAHFDAGCFALGCLKNHVHLERVSEPDIDASIYHRSSIRDGKQSNRLEEQNWRRLSDPILP
ncbi:hypothetical protein ACLOJK_039431 [Asimina triloba]